MKTDCVDYAEQWQPDEFFTAEQQQRLQELMTRWRAARDESGAWSNDEQQELEQLVDTQLEGAAKRARKMFCQQQNALVELAVEP